MPHRSCSPPPAQWASVAELSIDLTEIDSAGRESTLDVMELVTLPDSLPAAQEMLLDEFLDGMLHKLFVRKWRAFGRRFHWIMRLLDLFSLGAMLVLAFWLKESPQTLDRTSQPILSLLLLGPQVRPPLRSRSPPRRRAD